MEAARDVILALHDRSRICRTSLAAAPAGTAVHSLVEEPVTLDEDPFAGHVTETDVSEAIQ